MRKNGVIPKRKEKHMAFIPNGPVEDEPDYLNDRRKGPIRKTPRKSKLVIVREVPRQMLKRRLGSALVLYPFIHSFINAFEGSPQMLLLYMNLKYMKIATFAEVMKVHNLRKQLAAKYLRRLMDMGVVDRFKPNGKIGVPYCFSLTLKGKKQIESLEKKAGKIMEAIDLKKMDDWTDDDTGN